MADTPKLPCPICSIPLDIRKSVKGKPYTVCDRCGIQMFIRKEAGISALERILAGEGVPINPEAEKLRGKIHSLEEELAQKEEDLEFEHLANEYLSKTKEKLEALEKNASQLASSLRNAKKELTELRNLVNRTCPECGKEFQICERLIKTSWFNGSLQGYRCPKEDCNGVATRIEEV